MFIMWYLDVNKRRHGEQGKAWAGIPPSLRLRLRSAEKQLRRGVGQLVDTTRDGGRYLVKISLFPDRT